MKQLAIIWQSFSPPPPEEGEKNFARLWQVVSSPASSKLAIAWVFLPFRKIFTPLQPPLRSPSLLPFCLAQALEEAVQVTVMTAGQVTLDVADLMDQTPLNDRFRRHFFRMQLRKALEPSVTASNRRLGVKPRSSILLSRSVQTSKFSNAPLNMRSRKGIPVTKALSMASC